MSPYISSGKIYEFYTIFLPPSPPLLSNSLKHAFKMKYEIYPYDPVASPDQIIYTNNARFTVLTDSLIRMEYSPSQKFENRPTAAFVHRNLNPSFTFTKTLQLLTITTSKLILQYDLR